MEKIIRITEIQDVEDFDGWEVETTHRTVSILIDNRQDCCEDFGTGYVATLDTPQDYIGATVRAVTVTDSTMLTLTLIDNIPGATLADTPVEWDGITAFLTFETNRGRLQFTIYNDHNGYYSHACRVIATAPNAAVDYRYSFSI